MSPDQYRLQSMQRQLAVAERKSVIGLGPLGEWAGASRQDGSNFRTNMVTLAEYQDSGAASESAVLGLSAAWACVNLLAGTIASLPLMVYRTRDDGKRSVARDHPLYWLLHDSPNADQTALDFWEYVSACIEMRGNSFCEIDRAADGRVISLDVPIPPQAMTVRRLSTGALEYGWSIDGKRRTAGQDRILHIRGFGGSPLGGLSTLAFGRQAFGLALAVNRAAQTTFSNGVRPSGVLQFKEYIDSDKRTEARKLIEEQFAGTLNAGRPFILEGGADWKQITINPEDAQMLESRAFSVEEICRLFGVPPFMVGHTEKTTSWGTGIEQQTIGFVQFTLRRRLKRIEQSLEKQLLTPRDRAAGVRIEFNLEGLLRGDSKTRAEFYESGLKNKWRTINEVRELENLAPVPWGDRPWGQMQDVQLDEAGNIPPEDVG